MMTTNNRISVIIPHRASPSSALELVLSSLFQQSYSDFEVLVVCNPEITPDDQTLINKFPRAQFYSSAAGANCARNLGIEKSTGDLLLFLDDDCLVPDKNFLQSHQDLHKQNLDCIALGGPYVLKSNARLARCYTDFQNHWLQKWSLEKNYCRRLLGGHWSIKKSLLQDFRFDENLIFGATESELQQRLINHGHKFYYASHLAVEHHLKLSLTSFIEKAYRQGQGFAYMEKKLGPFYKDSKKIPNFTVKNHPLLSAIYDHVFHLGREDADLHSAGPKNLRIVLSFIFSFFKLNSMNREAHLKSQRTPQSKNGAHLQ